MMWQPTNTTKRTALRGSVAPAIRFAKQSTDRLGCRWRS